MFHSPEHRYELLLPQRKTEKEGLSLVLKELSGGEIIDLKTVRSTC